MPNDDLSDLGPQNNQSKDAPLPELIFDDELPSNSTNNSQHAVSSVHEQHDADARMIYDPRDGQYHAFGATQVQHHYLPQVHVFYDFLIVLGILICFFVLKKALIANGHCVFNFKTRTIEALKKALLMVKASRGIKRLCIALSLLYLLILVFIALFFSGMSLAIILIIIGCPIFVIWLGYWVFLGFTPVKGLQDVENTK